MIIALLTFIFLLIVATLDMKTMKVPSALSSGFLLFVSIMSAMLGKIEFGVIMILFALFLWDASAISGLADVKAFAIVGFSINSFIGLFTFVMMYVGVSNIYLAWMRYVKKEKGLIPYLNVVAFSYWLTLLINFVFPASLLL